MRKRKNEISEQVRSDLTMVEETASLKRSVASYKSTNSLQRKKIEQLEAYGKEADELNEKRIAEIDKLKTTIIDKEKTVAGLESQVTALKETIAECNDTIKNLRDVEAEYLAFLEKPWFKRIFFK